MADGYRIIGAEMSPYSVKVRAYFRYKGIPHQWILRNAASQAEFEKHAKMPIIPTASECLVLMVVALKSLEPGCPTCAKPHPKCKAPLLVGTAEECDEFAACHSITSSARCCRISGTAMPNVFAVFRLITSSYFVGACTGRSVGFSPLRMRSM